MEQTYSQGYKDLYQNHWWWRSREQFILPIITDLKTQFPQHWEILDVGCGDGLFFEKLSRFGTVEGVEPDPSLVSTPHHPHGKIYQRPFDSSFQPGKKYDLICMLDVIEHFENDQLCLSHALSLLKPNGRLLITVPALMQIWTAHDDFNHHFRRYSKTSFRALAQTTNMHIDQIQYFFGWLVPLKTLVSIKEKLSPSQPKPETVPHALINMIFYSIARMEQWLVRLLCRRSGPFWGSSLFITGTATTSSK